MTVLDDFDTELAFPIWDATWQPEDHLIGALLHLTAADAGELVELVPTTAIQQPIARWAYELISALVAAGHDPAPNQILLAARTQPPSSETDVPDALTITHLRPNILADLGIYLAHALTRVHDISAGRLYACDVLDDHFRRRTAAWAVRLQHMVSAEADRQDLTTAITEGMRGELRDLWQRAELAARDPAGAKPR
jgi:hypothetical protein